MAKQHIRHVRRQAREHEKRHLQLKNLLSKEILTEQVFSIFLSTFVIIISTAVIFFNWGRITSFFDQPDTPPSQVEGISGIYGFRTGILATYHINGQTADQYIRQIRQINTEGYRLGVGVSHVLGKHEEKVVQSRRDAFLASVAVNTQISRGYHLAKLQANQARSLQKSVLATYYLGRKTVNIYSSIQTDAELLAKIKNTLEVDMFAYLNQSADRANTLDNFLRLLAILEERAQGRSAELQSQINFLTGNFNAQDRSLELSEEAFFRNLSIFDGENAEEELAQFVGLQQNQTEVRAKIGAYQGLKDYYDFFLPKLENLGRAIRLNRDALIAGVKVVDVDNMTLPLIVPDSQ